MERSPLFLVRALRPAAYLLGAALASFCMLHAAFALADGSPPAGGPAWANPSVAATRRVSGLSSTQQAPNFLSNLDCTPLPYTAGDGSGRTGCFTGTPLGLMDSDSDTVLSVSNDRGLALEAYGLQEVLVPWPNSADLIALNAVDTGGSYISLYTNALSAAQNRRDAGGRLIAKQLTGPPDISLKDAAGHRLVVNPQTLAFSDNGSWMVVETLGGAFIRVNLATLDMVAFAPAFGAQGSPALLKAQVAITDDGRYAAIGSKDAGTLTVYDLSTCGPAAGSLQPQGCAAHDYQPFLTEKIAGLQAVRHVRFVNEDLLSFEAQTSDPASSGVYELAPEASIRSLIDYLALGDSYTSGEGAYDYLAGTDTAENECHLSAHSYPLLLARDLFTGAGGHSVGCSGAVINDLGSMSPDYRGQARGAMSLRQLQQAQAALLESIMAGYAPGYVAQQRFAAQYQPAVISVGVGGNDIGFGDIIQRCVMSHISLQPGANSCFSSYEDRLEVTNLIDRTVPRWIALYKQLLSEAPGARLYVIGYPRIVYADGNCAANVHLDRSELEFAEDLTDYLNAAIKQAADAAGAGYVDISEAFAGHRLCEAASYDVAVNGLTAGTDAGPLGLRVFGHESYHPTALGQALMEQATLSQTDNFTASTSNSAGFAPPRFLDVPKTGRPLNTLIPDDSLAPGVIRAGQTIPLQANGARDGLASHLTYQVRLDGAGGSVMGNVTSDDHGDISGSFTLPGNIAAGGHTIDLTGSNRDGEPVDVTQPVYAPNDEHDTDGDGIDDSLDTCPGAVNSGQDSDQDGVDDTCDNFIGNPSGASGHGNPPAATVVLTHNSILIQPAAALGLQAGSRHWTMSKRMRQSVPK